MSIDRSLKTKSALSRHRNVLSRAERVELLREDEKWVEGDAVTGLPKVAHRKAATGKKGGAAKLEEVAEGAEATEAAETTEATEVTKE